MSELVELFVVLGLFVVVIAVMFLNAILACKTMASQEKEKEDIFMSYFPRNEEERLKGKVVRIKSVFRK